ncbi:MAG: DnaJ domain-containing protein [Candidatus Hydrogenedentes bacterium]|nr:DnaJ domain-containing protein [Candidatus Hydrogenedentota bacterium]
MFGLGFSEFMLLVVVIFVLNAAGVWPRIIRGLRELRGAAIPEQQPANGAMIELGYKMLGVSPSAPWEEIERAYRTKAKIHHPDKGGDEDTMRALNDAYAQIKRQRGR